MIQTRFILIETSHAGNVGAVARAMKVMGFDDLILVRPRWTNVLRKEETIQRASGALDVLNSARIVDTLDQALEGMTHLCATAMTARDFGPPTSTPRGHLESLIKDIQNRRQIGLLSSNQSALGDVIAPMGQHIGVGFLFGSERFGMTNEDVYRCNVALQIPSNPNFGSLNIAAAVQLIAYEWRLCLGGFNNDAKDPKTEMLGEALEALADASQLGGLLQHWQTALEAVGFLNPLAPKKLMPRLNQLFNKAQMTMEEIHIFRGIAKAMIQVSEQARKAEQLDSKTVVQTLDLKKDRL